MKIKRNMHTSDIIYLSLLDLFLLLIGKKLEASGSIVRLQIKGGS